MIRFVPSSLIISISQGAQYLLSLVSLVVSFSIIRRATSFSCSVSVILAPFSFREPSIIRFIIAMCNAFCECTHAFYALQDIVGVIVYCLYGRC